MGLGITRPIREDRFSRFSRHDSQGGATRGCQNNEGAINNKDNYKDIEEEKDLKPKQKTVLIKEIGDRIVAAENQIAAQDLASLTN